MRIVSATVRKTFRIYIASGLNSLPDSLVLKIVHRGEEIPRVLPKIDPKVDFAFKWLFAQERREHDLVFNSDIMVITLELTRFSLEPDEITGPLEAWLYFLSRGDELDSEDLPPALNRAEIRKALEELNMLSQDDLERERYMARVRALRDEQSQLEEVDIARKELREAREKTREEARVAREEAREVREKALEALKEAREALEAMEEAREALEEARVDLEEARVEVREKARKEGLQEGMTYLVVRLLSRRLGPLENVTLEQIQKLRPEQLELLSEALLDFSGMDDLLNWLVQPPTCVLPTKTDLV